MVCRNKQSAGSIGSMTLSRISWYAEAFRVPFTGTKGPSPAPESQPITIIPPPPNFTLGTMQSDKNRSPGNHQTQTHPSDWRRRIRHSRERISTALEYSGSVLYTTPSSALHCNWWCMAWMQVLSHGNLFHDCINLATSAQYAPQHPLTLLCHFTWPTISWLSCCRSQSLTLCYNTTDSWLWNT